MQHDWRSWDNLEPVTVTSRRNAPLVNVAGRFMANQPANIVQASVTAKRRALTNKELAASFGAYTALDRAWLIPTENVSFEVKPGDYVTDRHNVQWTVLESDKNTWGTWFKCPSRDPIIAHNLSQTVQIWTPINTQSASGHRVPKWGYAGLDATGTVIYSAYYTLTAPLLPFVTSFTVAYRGDIQGQTPVVPFLAQIDTEQIVVTAVSSVVNGQATWTAVRGWNGTGVSIHNTAAVVALPPQTSLGKVQPMGGSVADNFGKHAIVNEFTAYLAVNVPGITNECQVMVAYDQTMTKYQVKAVRNPQRLDQLMELDLEVIA